MKKALLIILIILVILTGGILLFLHSFKTKSLPDYNANIQLKNLQSKVTIYRDNEGIPHIIADNEHDLYLAYGYTIAQDRLWQMDLIRRATQGRLSEIFGKDLVKTDLMLRTLQIPQKSDKIYKTLKPEMKIALDAFADGINQYIEQNQNKLPIEFKILGYKPDKWLPQNSLNIVGYIAWDLVMAWGNEITLYKIQNTVDSSLFAQFIPNFSTDSTIYDVASQSNLDLTSDLSTVGQVIENLGVIPFMASNNWAVSGKKTKSGKPILCNDMHLGYNIPGIWYQVNMIVKNKMDVTGVAIPGEPFVVAGHNDSIAWGMTNVMLDGTDFYIETLNKDSTKYLLDGKWKDLKIVNEKIATKEGDTVVLPIRYTHRGPIISEFKGVNKAISMHWIGYENSNEAYGVYLLNKAHNWQDFRNACKQFGAVSQNIIYADVKGNIGLQLTGLIAKRKIPGYYLLPGDTSYYDWTGFVPFDSLPYVFNPKNGIVVSANNKSSNNVDYYISQYYFQDYRYNRIHELLEACDTIDNNYMAEVQSDQVSKMVQKFLPTMLTEFKKLDFKDAKSKKIIDYLSNWDDNMSANSVAAMFFEQFDLLFIKNSVADELGDKLFNEMLSSKILSNNILTNLWTNSNNPLFDNVKTKDKVENFDDIVKLTFNQTIDTLTALLGDNPDNWQYGRLHNLTLSHPLSKVKILDKVFKLNRGPFAVGGSNHTVSPYSYVYTNPYYVSAGASERHIFDLSNWDNSWTVIPTGESGQAASPFYCNQSELYINNGYHPDLFSIENIKKNAKFTCTLTPEK